MHLPKTGLFALLLTSLPIFAGSPAVPGIENFHQVSQNVYRGAQPTNKGFEYLSSLGVKVVIDLREHDSRARAEERAVTAAGMRYINIPMTGMTPPTETETAKLLGILEDPSAGPVFVHCKRGADRTGAVIASYRIHHDNWDNSRALDEAMNNRMSIFQRQRQKFIRTFQPSAVELTVSAPVTTNATPQAVAATAAAPSGN
jgi:tyrosine-protein phosphatase SIW14